jgi:amino acid permease
MKNLKTNWILYTVLRIVGIFVFIFSIYMFFISIDFVIDADDVSQFPQTSDDLGGTVSNFISVVLFSASFMFLISSIFIVVMTSKKLKQLKNGTIPTK